MQVIYCSADCQKLHWPTHKKFCKQLYAAYLEVEEAKKKAVLEQKAEEERLQAEKGTENVLLHRC